MRRLAAISLLVAVAAGCGGGGGGDKNTDPLQLSGPPSSPSCDKAGISDGSSSGTCKAGNTAIALAGSTETLPMKDYDVQLTGIRRANRLGRRVASNFGADTQFVIATLRIKNTGSEPLRFDPDSNLAFLLVGGTEYLEEPGAEDEVKDSFHAHGPTIAPGESAVGTVVFDPPADEAKTAGTEGTYLVFLNPEDAGNGYPRLGKRAIGFLRLWE